MPTNLVLDTTPYRKIPVLELTIEDLNLLLTYLRDGYPLGEDIIPIESVAFFITKFGKQKLILDLKIKDKHPAQYLGRHIMVPLPFPPVIPVEGVGFPSGGRFELSHD
ncbi:hypothetical protein [Dyadobacter sp. CY356]|uniref:hypothetical protein n=1 Tax=Dyadobacter sp. CY356 TaxID=2906442 RepID=UPI001F35AC35|nr:hypothetical protein [Dyadobacter sp. CY356]MCF0054656.1 hypothetical protein [Dyadobacter sp. CY356]